MVKLNSHWLAIQSNVIVLLESILCRLRMVKPHKGCARGAATARQPHQLLHEHMTCCCDKAVALHQLTSYHNASAYLQQRFLLQEDKAKAKSRA
jgi:hypothetical protein